MVRGQPVIPGRSPATRCAVTLALVVLGFASAMLPVRDAAAHAELVHTSPAVDGIVPSFDGRLRLWYSQAIASGDGSPSVHVLDERGRQIHVTSVGVDPGDPTEVVAATPPLSAGTYTVVWHVISSVDGHPLQGTFAFQVRSGLPAGAATAAGQMPALWAVALRWLTFLGAALALGGCLIALVVQQEAGARRGDRRRGRAILAGAIIALGATVLEPVLQAHFPPQGLTGSFLDVVRGQPAAWWLRPGALIPFIILGLISAYPLRGRMPRPLAGLGLALGAVALLGLALTGHGAARATWRDAAAIVDLLHLLAGALLAGGLAHLALWWPFRSAAPEAPRAQTRTLRRISAIALVLFIVAVATGLGSAAFVLPAISSLWSSDYGYALIAKALVLLVPCGLVVYRRHATGRAANGTRGAVLQMVRVGAIAALVVVLGGSVLALSASPAVSQESRDGVRLVAPALDANGQVQFLLHLTVDPAATGRNRLEFHLTEPSGRPLSIHVPPLLSAIFTSLTFSTVQAHVGAQPDPHHPGDYVIDGLQLSLNDWWQIVVQIEISGQTPTEADFYVLMPDPNVRVPGSPPATPGDAAAQALYARGLANLRGLSRLRYSQAVNTGRDQFSSRQLAVIVDPRTGQTAASSSTEAGQTTVTIGSRSWQQGADGHWRPSEVAPLAPMAAWGTLYGGGTDACLGIAGQMNGEATRVVTFYRPRSGEQAPAWFAWWIGTRTGRVYQIAMVGDQQYLLQANTDFDGAFTITPPAGG